MDQDLMIIKVKGDQNSKLICVPDQVSTRVEVHFTTMSYNAKIYIQLYRYMHVLDETQPAIILYNFTLFIEMIFNFQIIEQEVEYLHLEFKWNTFSKGIHIKSKNNQMYTCVKNVMEKNYTKMKSKIKYTY